MARLARVVVPGLPYHVTHRGNQRARIFFEEEDRESYLAHLERYCRLHDLQLWAWCLMTVHLLVVPARPDSMAPAQGHAHGKYAQWVNSRRGLTGHLWANRYDSTILHGDHLWAAVRYVELNPVRAAMVSRPEEYPWSSAAVH